MEMLKYFCLIIFVIQSCSSINVEVEYPKGSKTFIKKSLMEYINEGKGNATIEVSKNAIMVLGLSGTGKTTLVNYLNGNEMICFKKNGIWVVDLKNQTNIKSCGSIGHESQSETLYPSICTPFGANYSYVDNPGFKETRGL